MIYIIKENRAKARVCQIYRGNVAEDGSNYYQHLYEDNVGKPLSLDRSSKTVYFKSNKGGLIEKVQLGNQKQVKDLNLINVNMDNILGMFKLDIKF